MAYVSHRKMIIMPMISSGVIISQIQPMVRFKMDRAIMKIIARETIRPNIYRKVSKGASFSVVNGGILKPAIS